MLQRVNTYLLHFHRATLEYLPFYGGGKGQYLEIKKNNLGVVTSEKIVSEDKISTDVIKNNDDSLLAKLLTANLESLRTITNNLLKLHNVGRKTGYLSNPQKVRFRTQLASLGETASNSIKLIEDIGDNVDGLFKKTAVARRYGQPDFDDDVGEEGVSVDAPSSSFEDDGFEDRIAEAKPVGLAVIGEHGLAASRPIGTAIAASGVAISRPIATAIAGVDPSALGLNLQINHFGRSKTRTRG
ncbi:hypothetical protein O3G_MSEX000037 [Manduca sexta]|nr:hypothetical protein O3G_MSEX000037 [Manduca sexta]